MDPSQQRSAVKTLVYGDEDTPYVARTDLLMLKKAKELQLQAQNQEGGYKGGMFDNRNNNQEQITPRQLKQVKFGRDQYQQPVQIDESLNDRDEAFLPPIVNPYSQPQSRTNLANQFMTPQINSSKKYNLRSSQDREISPNPLLGDSEGEQRKRVLMSEYKDYLKHQQLQGSAKELDYGDYNNLSKRQTRYLQKKQESLSKSPQRDNIYATKQRYKYSNIQKPNQLQGTSSYLDFQEAPPQTGYILKTDPIKQLYEKEIQKQDYQRALKEQMEINQHRKQVEKEKKLQYDNKLEQEIKSYYQEMQQVPSRYDEIPAQAMLKNAAQPSQHHQSVRQSLQLRQSLQSLHNSNNAGLQNSGSSNKMIEGYEQLVKERERQREEWKQTLQSQMQEQEQQRQMQKLRQKQDDFQDEQRLLKQLQEINQSVQTLDQIKSDKLPTQQSLTVSRKEELSHLQQNTNTANMLKGGKTGGHSLQTDRFYDITASYSTGSITQQTTQKERSPIQQSHVQFPQAQQKDPIVTIDYGNQEYVNEAEKELQFEYARRETQKQMARLEKIQQEMQQKNKQNSTDSAAFFKELLTQSKQILNQAMKNPPKNDYEMEWSKNPVLEYLPFYSQSVKMPTVLTDMGSDFLKARKRQIDTEIEVGKALKREQFVPYDPHKTPGVYSMTDEVDQLLTQFANI
ncbi:hypothetical protein FGO68_gene3809 [Halteria grandinella]|uniref:Uncharacterized protein n=1 Tax=Halteria grandinella TaxID=5974 RepID=A0A8J8NX42_HALGN|nr:hypothetical protein FGO68_gene3809 [Halteria grandinella]